MVRQRGEASDLMTEIILSPHNMLVEGGNKPGS